MNRMTSEKSRMERIPSRKVWSTAVSHFRREVEAPGHGRETNQLRFSFRDSAWNADQT